MEFEKKYISATEKLTASVSDKRIVLSDDAYSLVEAINDLISIWGIKR